MFGRRRTISVNVWAALLPMLAAAVQGCAGHEHAPPVVPSELPLTAPGDRFDVVVPAHTPVIVIAVNQDPDDEAMRAFRYDWVAGGEARAGQRRAADGPLTLEAMPARGFLYVDAVHRLPEGGSTADAAEQKSRMRWARLGDGVWRLYFRDPDRTNRRDDLVVTVRFLGRQAPAPSAAVPPPATAPAARRGRDPAAPPPVPTWGEKELGRPVHLNPCRVCHTTEHLARRVTDNKRWYWVRCNNCNNARMAQTSPDEAEAVWNGDNPRPADAPPGAQPPP